MALSRASSLLDAVNARLSPEPDELSLTRAPSSPSNSWSSTETAQVGADSPKAEGDDPRRPKRCKISREQLTILIKSFEEEPLPNFEQRQTLAKLLGMTPRSVQIWFQNRRQRLKPMNTKPGTSSAGIMGGASAASRLQAHQALGMPGLAAAAGLCNGAPSGIDQLMISHALSQAMQAQAAPGMHNAAPGYPAGLTYDLMEPFAATKALLSASSAMGLAPHACPTNAPATASMAGLQGVRETFMANLAALAQTNPEALAAHQAHGARVSPALPAQPAAPTPAPKSEKADGLLLLLACADNGTAEVGA
jgi:hypothetical protein